MTTIKVAFCHIYLSPYRTKFFGRLYQQNSLSIDFFIGSIKPRGSPWIVNMQTINFRHKDLLSLKFKGFPLFNPSLAFELIKGKYHVFISGALEFPGTYVAFICAQFLRRPFILWCGETSESLKSGIEHSPIYRIFRLYILKPIITQILKMSDAFIVYGLKQKEYLMSLGAPAQRIHIALNAPDVDFLDTTSDKLEVLKRKYQPYLKIKHELSKKLILYVGQLEKQKRVDVLIKAFQLAVNEKNDAILLIVGSGSQKEELLKIADRYDNIYFIDYIPREDLAFFYNQCEFVVLPGLGGVALVEALYAGKPAIATNECDNASMLINEGENGHLVSPGNVHELYLAMRNILGSADIVEKMGNSSKRIVEQMCSIERMAEVFRNTISRVTMGNHD